MPAQPGEPLPLQHKRACPLTPRAACTGDYEHLVDIWERAVRATHTFLAEGDITALRAEIPAYFPHVALWVLDDGERPAGFMGMDGRHIAMLFVDPHWHRRGMGTALISFAVHRYGLPLTVDVNEQNPAAHAFYLRQGFRQFGRSPLDDQGRPFPLLHLRKDTAC
ncbi:MAG TPA: acetyltransferase [Candidatus Avidesulfovibrio excrementigallinarum]|nr:acetyltransferase [Candidatus Avidesulfovibrio excrementigallinarum]